MIKVTRILAPENGMPTNEINSFETENYYGIWDHNLDRFALIKKKEIEYSSEHLSKSYYDNLQEIDDEVYELIEERIIGVSDSSSFRFIIDECE